ncbi:MAG: hypothetical protein LBH85_04995, partial [Treponema sp.]|nr:hypothetical protein [Treponema sp.]
MTKVTEYDCWFQKRESLDGAGDITGFLENVTCEEKGSVIENAAEELRLALSRCFGVAQKDRKTEENTDGKRILLGTIDYINAKYDFSLPKQKSEGFVIWSADSRIVIGGTDEQGVLYGAYRFVSLIALNRFVFGVDV